MKIPEKLNAPLRMAIVSMIICGLVFPVAVTGIAELAFPFQANGEQATFNNTSIGSYLIAQEFTAPVFFHPRNDSASGVDPDIMLSSAYAQIPGISNSTGISSSILHGIVDNFVSYTMFFFGTPYINVLQVNLYLVEHYSSVYSKYVKAG